ncbi:MAG: TIGR02757 family protein [Chitinispirillaceae bacterium]|jgi:uncharacterized protein (TIGR02757 family)|nr:TIGR02757 family protein [Chitinispirillaceae bacterium]
MNAAALKKLLEQTYDQFHKPEYLQLDPLICLRAFDTPADIEIAGLVAASLAYGKVENIIKNVSRIFDLTSKNITVFCADTTLAQKQKLLGHIKHRFTEGNSVALLLHTIGRILMNHGSLERLFIKNLNKDDATIKPALENFVSELRLYAHRFSPEDSGIRYLLSSPASGSACKRLNMYLRWMIRPADGIDLGIWKQVSASKLLIPLDTHVARISRSLGLTGRSTVNWQMAEEITAKLRVFDPLDPVRYDFSLCRTGMISHRKKAA